MKYLTPSAITNLLLRQPGFDFHVLTGIKFYVLGQWMLGLAAALAIWSGAVYLRAA